MSAVILDTNVVSELQRTGTSGPLAPWLPEQDEHDLLTTAITVSEIAVGVAALPRGRRRDRLERWLDDVVRSLFAGRILPFDAEAGRAYGPLVASARAGRRAPGVSDAQIAAIAAGRDLPVATRDVRDFATLGVTVVNPWDAA